MIQPKTLAILILCGVIVAASSATATLYYCIETSCNLYTANPFEAVVSGYPQFCNSTNVNSLGDEPD